jgi:hypothetical protein
MEFSVPKRHNGLLDPGQGHLKAEGEEDGTTGLTVRVERLDDVASECAASSAGLLKIDVEGAELSVLQGAPNLLGIGRPVIICEIQDVWCARYGSASTDVFDLLRSYDYRATKLVEGEFEDVAQSDPNTYNYAFFPQ